jgi:DNA-binding transcriptional ArsR family regulator
MNTPFAESAITMEQPYLIQRSVYGSLSKLPKKAVQLFWGELMATATQDHQAAIKLPTKLHASARELVSCGVAIETSDGMFGLNHEVVRIGPAEPEMVEIMQLDPQKQCGMVPDQLETSSPVNIAERNALMDRCIVGGDVRAMGPHALMVLTCLVTSLEERTVPELAERTGMTVARVRAGLRTLRDMGYALEEKEPRYRLGGSKVS